MENNNNIIFGYTLEKYNKKYRHRGYRLLKYTKKEVEEFDKLASKNVEVKNFLLKGRKWAFIKDAYYEIPRPIRFTWFRNLNAGVQTATCVLLAGAIGGGAFGTYYLLNNKGAVHNEEVFIEGDATYDVSKSFVAIGKESTLYLKPKKEGLKLKIKNVYVGDVELAASEYTFTPDDNKLVIQASSMNSLKIKIKLEETTDLRKLFIEKADEWVSGNSGFLKVTTIYTKEQITSLTFKQKQILATNYSIVYDDYEGSRVCYLSIKESGKADTPLMIGGESFSGQALDQYLLPVDDGGVYDVKDTYIEYSTTKEDAYLKHIKLNKWGYVEEMVSNDLEASITYEGDPHDPQEDADKTKFLNTYVEYQGYLKTNTKVYSESEIPSLIYYDDSGVDSKLPVKWVDYKKAGETSDITIYYLDGSKSDNIPIGIGKTSKEDISELIKPSTSGAVYTFTDDEIKYYDPNAESSELEELVVNCNGIFTTCVYKGNYGYKLNVIDGPFEKKSIGRDVFLGYLDAWSLTDQYSFAKSTTEYSSSQIDNVLIGGKYLDKEDYELSYKEIASNRVFQIIPTDETINQVAFGSPMYSSSVMGSVFATEAEGAQFYITDNYIEYKYEKLSQDKYMYFKMNKDGYVTRMIEGDGTDTAISYLGNPQTTLDQTNFLNLYDKYRNQYLTDISNLKGFAKKDIASFTVEDGNNENNITVFEYNYMQSTKTVSCQLECNYKEDICIISTDQLTKESIAALAGEDAKFYFDDVTRDIKMETSYNSIPLTMVVSKYGYFLQMLTQDVEQYVLSFGSVEPHTEE